ncbi:MAG: hypothetical protein DRI44_04655 [Chlamydiae bacterium]|nr:MAG: hypothetical protein DRI44_04655 [Chlamydiota bacterium]
MISRGVPSDRAEDAARAICVKSTGLTWKRETFDEADILCEKVGEISTEDKRYVYFAGTALVPGVSRNYVHYTKEEIERAYHTLEGVKLNMNHDIMSPPIGRVVSTVLGENGEVNFVAEVDTMINPSVAAALESGYIDHVSIEANPEWAECSICGQVYGECNHIRGRKYPTKEGEATCTIVPHNFEFKGLAVVFGEEGVPAAKIAHEVKVPIFIEKISEKVVKEKMSEQVTMKDIQKMLEEARKEWEEKHSQELEVMKEQKSELEKQLEETRNKAAQMEKRERQRLAREVALLEANVMPKTYKLENVDKREKELAEWSMQKLETRKSFLAEAKENSVTKNEEIKENVPIQKGGFIHKPIEEAVNHEDLRKTIEFLEHKRIIEKALGFNKPLREDFVQYCMDNDIVFKKDPKSP